MNDERGDPFVAKMALKQIFAMLDARPNPQRIPENGSYAIVEDEDVPPEPEYVPAAE